MLLGHLGIAGILRRFASAPSSTGLLLAFAAAAYAPDILDVAYVVAGFCNPYGLYSHTIPAVALQAAIIGGVTFLAGGSRRLTILFVAVVFMHLPADFLTGRKLFMPGGELMGLAINMSGPLDALLEIPVICLGWWVGRRSTTGPPWARSRWILVAVLAPQMLANAYQTAFHLELKPQVCFDGR